MSQYKKLLEDNLNFEDDFVARDHNMYTKSKLRRRSSSLIKGVSSILGGHRRCQSEYNLEKAVNGEVLQNASSEENVTPEKRVKRSKSLSCSSSKSRVRSKVFKVNLGERWIEVSDLILSKNDHEIIRLGLCLNDQIIHCAQLILKSQFPKLNGFQDFRSHEIAQFKRYTEPAVQIHRIRRYHWVLSIVDSYSEDVLVLDSCDEGGDVPSILKSQLHQLYDLGRTRQHVSLPSAQQLTTVQDSGLLTLAFLVEYCINRYRGGCFVMFKTTLMRTHLIQCLNDHHFTPFPKEKPKHFRQFSE
ncbi:uncharacterized protein LOC126819676 [Patella vulgata]|uniref:uncharacterized protein LOC126819676 n=1 Tax=Patella vulgata TaxID=6465 RepID=UPI0024A82359|nr:uncharacterized protein LOC126819676 [Patella vulgata]